MKAEHGTEHGRTAGLGAALAGHYRVLGLEREQVLERLLSVLAARGTGGEDEALALTEVMHPAHDQEETISVAHLGAPAERHAVILRALRRIARERPLVLWIDEAHYADDSLAIVRSLMASRSDEPCPILVVMTVRPENLRDRPAEQLLPEILGMPGVQRIELWPLTPGDTRDLVRRLLHLEGDLATQVEERTQGNPLFATQLVGNWVDRGMLELGTTGFRLRKGSTAEIPDGLHSVWAGRIHQFLEGRSVHDGTALELAAVLGQQVTETEFWDACDLAGLVPSLDLVDTLLDECLASCGPGGPEEGWSFVHAMLRESLERRAAEGDRVAAHHLACAEMLEVRSGPGITERLGRHLIGAEQPERSIQPLLGGAGERLEAGDVRRAKALLGEHDRTLHALRVPWDDVRRGKGWLLRVRLAAMQGDEEAFAEWASRTEKYADTHAWERVTVELTYEQARRASRVGQLEDAWSQLLLVEMAATESQDLRLLARCIFEQARVAERRGDRREAVLRYRQAMRLFQELEDGLAAANALLALAELVARDGELAESEEYLELASDLFVRWGNQTGRARCSELMGLIARLQADFASAVTCYRTAAARYRAIGSAETRRAETSLAQALVWNGEYQEAGGLLAECLKHFDARDETPAAAAIHAAMLPGLASTERWGEFDGHLEAASRLLDATGFADEDVAWSARLAGQVATEHEDGTRAKAAYELSLRMFEATGRHEEAAAVTRVLARF